MARGTVKFFNDAKGFGFVAPEDGGADFFVHVSAVERAGLPGLSDGDEVAFEVEQDRRSGKMSAVDLQFLGSGSPAAKPRRPAGGGRGLTAPIARHRLAGGGQAAIGSGTGVVKWFNPATRTEIRPSAVERLVCEYRIPRRRQRATRGIEVTLARSDPG
jgi:CspA family cold shock protein